MSSECSGTWKLGDLVSRLRNVPYRLGIGLVMGASRGYQLDLLSQLVIKVQAAGWETRWVASKGSPTA